MKCVLLSISCFCCLLTLVADAADESPIKVQSPFLWKIQPVTDDATAKLPTAFLLGTIHVPDKNLTTLHPLAQQAFDSADAVYFEIDFLKHAAAQTSAISLPAGKKLEELIPAALLTRLDQRLTKISPLMNRTILPNAHVSVWPLLLGNLEAQVRKLGQLPMDMKLYHAARARGKTVGGLEEPTSQLDPLINLPLAEQITFLTATLDAMDDGDRNHVDRLELTMKLYAAGDETEFGAFIESEFRRIELPDDLRNRIAQGLLTDRNQLMADSILDKMSASLTKSCFFAVGAGHLVGENSVQQYLKKKNLRVERMTAASVRSSDQVPSR